MHRRSGRMASPGPVDERLEADIMNRVPENVSEIFLLSLLSISRQSYKEGCLGLGGCVRCDAGTDKLGVAALIEATLGATVDAAAFIAASLLLILNPTDNPIISNIPKVSTIKMIHILQFSHHVKHSNSFASFL